MLLRVNITKTPIPEPVPPALLPRTAGLEGEEGRGGEGRGVEGEEEDEGGDRTSGVDGNRGGDRNEDGNESGLEVV